MEANIEEYKIWYPYEAFYIESMRSLTHSAQTEVTVFREIVRQIGIGDNSNENLIIDCLQNFFNHTASLSRYFWPTNKGKVYQIRGERLREAFEVDDSSPLKDRRIRNFIEHFDEKLDEYIQKKGLFGEIFPLYVGYKSQMPIKPVHLFRAYFLDEASFVVLDLEYKVEPFIKEVFRIHNLLISCSDNGGRLPLK